MKQNIQVARIQLFGTCHKQTKKEWWDVGHRRKNRNSLTSSYTHATAVNIPIFINPTINDSQGQYYALYDNPNHVQVYEDYHLASWIQWIAFPERVRSPRRRISFRSSESGKVVVLNQDDADRKNK